jgi:hypothetical protein
MPERGFWDYAHQGQQHPHETVVAFATQLRL